MLAKLSLELSRIQSSIGGKNTNSQVPPVLDTFLLWNLDVTMYFREV